MKTVILCGGRGTRMGEHGAATPKALIEIGGRPVLWHLLMLYTHYGLDDFILCLGHLGDEIRNYFENTGVRQQRPWTLTFADTGLDTNTGGRIKLVERLLKKDENFCVTYGDGLADLDLRALVTFHKEHGRIGTITAVRPHLNFGIMKISNERAVTEFHEKPLCPDWINGGFFVFRNKFLELLDDKSVLEHEPLETLALKRELLAWQHNGFWKCMDTYKDNIELNQLWEAGEAAWKVWER